MNKFLGEYPGKILHQIGVLLLGIWLTGNILNVLWPNNNEIKKGELIISKEEISSNHLRKEVIPNN